MPDSLDETSTLDAPDDHLLELDLSSLPPCGASLCLGVEDFLG